MNAGAMLILIAAGAIGLVATRLALRSRGGRRGEWSWRDGGIDPDV